MLRFVVLAALAAVAAAQHGQYVPSKQAAILSEARYLSGNGNFGAAYTQEDGTDFKEETDADGTRRGSYSYIDPNGQRRTISYTAGKDGFKATGDHIPVAPKAAKPVAPSLSTSPSPSTSPSGPAQPQQYQAQPQYQEHQWDQSGQYNPPAYEEWNQQPAGVQNAPAFNAKHITDPLWNAHTQPHWAQQVQQPQRSLNAIPDYETTPTPNRHFHPPGKLSLSRSNDGFSYTFNKN
ncbi:Hypothetical predicted protein [Cloeon dipterum]|uniref:Uncharacterized protein n=1 Tax=Cloeon dipterum TaxID=197152 RepID=A0A8S1CTT1_9INSE|nr:Hypothetical predicted protein [Cloeon dipterum]